MRPDEGTSTGVNDSLEPSACNNLSGNLHTVQLDQPKPLSFKASVLDVTSVELLINSTQYQGRSLTLFSVSQEEREDVLINEALFDHIIEDGRNTIH